MSAHWLLPVGVLVAILVFLLLVTYYDWRADRRDGVHRRGRS